MKSQYLRAFFQRLSQLFCNHKAGGELYILAHGEKSRECAICHKEWFNGKRVKLWSPN